jgi:hypothetical protein
MKITRDVIYFPSAKCIIIHYFGQGRRNRGGREVHREHIPPPPPLPNFFQRTKSALLCDEKWPYCTFALANVAVNTILTSKVIFLFLEHIYVCLFTQASSVVNTNLRHVSKSNERNL